MSTPFRRSEGRGAVDEAPPMALWPPCARCTREGGVVVAGAQLVPQRADVLPDHTWGFRERPGGPRIVERRGVHEPLCARHLELAAWEEHDRRNRGAYPRPSWTRATPPSEHVLRVLRNLLGSDNPTEHPFQIPPGTYGPRDAGDDTDDL